MNTENSRSLKVGRACLALHLGHCQRLRGLRVDIALAAHQRIHCGDQRFGALRLAR
jgi:hypothetical protein